MQMSSVNSLAEVGIGINLAYGAFKGMREGLYNSYVEALKTKVDTIQARLNEIVNGNGRSGFAVKTEDISNNYSDAGRNLTNKMVIFALASAIILTCFLAQSAITPCKEIPDWTIYFFLFFSGGPLCISAVAQYVLYNKACRYLDKRLLPYINFVDVSDEIDPKPPTA